MSDSPETTPVVVTDSDSSPVARDDSNASDIPHADLLSALDKTPLTAMADIVSTQVVPEADVADKEVVDVVSKDVPLQVAEDGLAGVEDSKVEGPTGTTLLATDGPAPIPPVQDAAVTTAEDVEDATVAKPTPVTVTEEEEARPEKAFSQEDTKEVVSSLPTIEPTGANNITEVDTEDKAVVATEHDTVHLSSTEEDNTEAAPTDTITIPTAATVPELHPLDSSTALLSSKDEIPTSEAKEDVTIADPEPAVQLVIPVDDVKPDFGGLEDGASQDELSSNQAESLTLQQGAVEGPLTDKDDQELEIPIEPEMTFAAPSSPILPAAKSQPPQDDVPALPQEPEVAVAEPVVDTKDEEDASPEAEAESVIVQKEVEEVKYNEKPSLESVDSTVPAQEEPVADTTEDGITKDEATSVDSTVPAQDGPAVDTTEDAVVKDEPTSANAESKYEPVPEKTVAEEAAPVASATGGEPEAEESALDQGQPKIEATAEENLAVTASDVEENAAPEPVREEEPVKVEQPAVEAKLDAESDAVVLQEQPTVGETPEEPVVEVEAEAEAEQKDAVDVSASTLDVKVEETVATEEVRVDEVLAEVAAISVESEQAQALVRVVVNDEKPEPEKEKVEDEPAPKPEEKAIEVEERSPEPVKVEEEEKLAEDESSRSEEPEEPIIEKSEPEVVPQTQEPEPELVKAEEPVEMETPQEEYLKVEQEVESAEPVLGSKAVEHEAIEEAEKLPASIEEHEEIAAEANEQEPTKVEESEENAAEPTELPEVIERAPLHEEGLVDGPLETDQPAAEATKGVEENELVDSEIDQKPVETEAFEKKLAEEDILEQENEPVKDEPEQNASALVDSAEKEVEKAEEPEQVPETTAGEARSLNEPQLAAHSITATDSSADSVDEPITPSVVVQNLEAVETNSDDEVEHTTESAVATGEIERPKSPWTPSFTVSTLGGPVAEAEQDDAEDEAKPEPAVVSLLVTDDDGKVQPPEESTPAPPARPWTPSYSVHSQGNSPIQKPVELEDEVPEVPARSWTPSYSVHSQGNSPIQKPVELEDEVPEAPLTKEAETLSHIPPVDEVAEPAEVPVSTQPIVESTTHEDVPSEGVEVSTEQSARVDNADLPVLETASAPEEDTGTVEKTTEEPIADTTPASTVDIVGSDEVASAVPNEVDTETAGVDEVENKVEPVSKTSEESEEDTSAATPETDEVVSETPELKLVEEAPAEKPAVPSVGESLSATDVEVVSPVPLVAPVPVVGSSVWVPSYSVSRQGSRQGSPLLRPQDTVEDEDDGATVAKAPVPAPDAVDTLQKDIPAISETDANAISAPAGGQEAVARSWTPSYSVTTQGPIAEPDLSAAQDGNASSAAPKGPEVPIDSDIEVSGPTPETLKEATTNGAAVATEHTDPESSSGIPPTHETPVVASTSDPLETRKRLESTASSRFFPGSWFSAAAKPPVPEEGRASLETASGQFSRGPSSPLDTGAMLSPITINTENLAVPEGEYTEDSAVSPSKRKWCSIM
ncbi:hypothetical protein MD484_g3782, partial [Candolleomyces efflorescens]